MTCFTISSLIDLTLEHDLLLSTKPLALLPLISTMPHLAYKCVPVVPWLPLPFPYVQSLSNMAQLHLTLRSPLPSYLPLLISSSLLLCHPSSSSGQATPDSDNPVSTTMIELFNPGNGSLMPDPKLCMIDKTHFKNNCISALSLLLLSANHEDKKERKGHKCMEKFMKYQQALQELRIAECWYTYFRNASH